MDRYQIFKTLQDEDFFDTNLEPLRDAVAARLKHYKFHYQIDEDAITYSIPSIPSNKNRERRVFDIEDAKKFLECNLDDYSTIDGYKAIANLKTNRIECLLTSLVPITAQGLSSAIIKGRIYNPIKITHPDNNEIQISIEQVSRELCVAATCSHVNVSMSISGIELNTNARQILEKYSTSLFFQMDMLEVSSYALARETNPSPSTRKRKVRNARIYELKFPELDLESGPASLYWYGRAAAQMPLLRFLAYYQVAEFYFPRFSKKNAHQKIKNILKDPTFRAFKDSDIEKILKAIKVSGSGKLGDEKAQFATTLSDCIEADDLLNFVTQDEAHKNHFCGGKDGGLSRFKIPANDNSQIYNAIANRLYEIRCKIVHTKDDHDEGGPTVLLPGSETAYTIGLDTSLMKFIAQRILIHTSGEINI